MLHVIIRMRKEGVDQEEQREELYADEGFECREMRVNARRYPPRYEPCAQKHYVKQRT